MPVESPDDMFISQTTIHPVRLIMQYNIRITSGWSHTVPVRTCIICPPKARTQKFITFITETTTAFDGANKTYTSYDGVIGVRTYL